MQLLQRQSRVREVFNQMYLRVRRGELLGMRLNISGKDDVRKLPGVP